MGNSAFQQSSDTQKTARPLARRLAGLISSAALGLTMLATAPTLLAQEMPKGSVADGSRKNSMCIGCHGIAEYKTAFPVLYRVPLIAGQHEAYLYNALMAYKAGDRSHPSMKAIAASLTPQDMADLAAFYARLGRQ